jgi:diaminopimelate epimerase
MIVFTKMHGLGNDFVIINKDALPGSCELQDLSVNIANRYTGIGCDQVIFYQKKSGYYEMFIYNNDGSTAKLCGNASRCLAKLIYLDAGERQIKLKVGNRELFCKVLSESEISVNIGAVDFNKEWMPDIETIWPIAELYMIDLKEIICADVGNPHLVIFSNISDQDKEVVGEKLQNKELFPDGVNVNFAAVKNNKIYLSVWERGAGLTFACGSGACASFASAAKLGFITGDCEVVFQLGSLKMSKEVDNIIMTGPASLVAHGEFVYG